MQIQQRRRKKYILTFSDAEITLLNQYRKRLANTNVPDVEMLLAHLFQNQVDFVVKALQGDFDNLPSNKLFGYDGEGLN